MERQFRDQVFSHDGSVVPDKVREERVEEDLMALHDSMS